MFFFYFTYIFFPLRMCFFGTCYSLMTCYVNDNNYLILNYFERERDKLCWKVGHEPNEHMYGLLVQQVLQVPLHWNERLALYVFKLLS